MAQQQQHASGCWWLYDIKKLDLEWQSVCARAQQQLMKIADSIQKTTYVPIHPALAGTSGLPDAHSSRQFIRSWLIRVF